MGFPDPLGSAARLFGLAIPDRRRRRSWVSDGRAHIEARGVRKPGNESVVAHFEAALREVEGVQWAQVNAITGRIAVMFDPDGVSFDDLVEVIEGVEDAHGLTNEGFSQDHPEHPSDTEPILRNSIAIGADILGLGFSVFGQFLPTTPIPSEIASAISLIENEPRFRRYLEHHLGIPVADLGLGLANAFAQALSQGPAGLVVSIANRANLISELVARRELWERSESKLYNDVETTSPVALLNDERPIPLRPGPIERYSDRSAIVSMGAFGVTLLATGSPRRAANALAAGIPKAAQMGRESFSAYFDRTLAQRGILAMDRNVLRKLDRIDTVVLDSEVLVSGRAELGVAECFEGAEAADVIMRAQEMFDPAQIDRVLHSSDWTLGPVKNLLALDVSFPRGARTRAKKMALGHLGVHGLAYRGNLVGLITIESELNPFAIPLVSLIKRNRLMLVVAGSGGLGTRLGATRTVPGRRAMRSSIRALQSEGFGVLLVSAGTAHLALDSADCGVGIAANGTVVPGGADILAPGGLADAYRIIDAIQVSSEVARRSVLFALGGSGIGGVWSLLGPASSAGRRASLPVNLAAVASQINGVMSAVSVGRRPDVVPLAQTSWHALETDSVLGALRTSVEGLDGPEAERRRPSRSHELPQAVKFVQAIGMEMANPLTPVLAAGAALSAAVGSISDAVLVAGVTGANAVIGGIQRVRTEVSIANLMQVDTSQIAVRRSAATSFMDAKLVVPGDILELSAGDVVPADCRILETDFCETDESALTGEPYPVAKQTVPVPGATLAERSCMLYEGSTLVNGSALVVVVATGDETEVGRSLADAPIPPPSGVEARLQRLTSATIPATVASGMGVAALSLLRGRSLRYAVTSGVSLTVAAVPEGLPLLATVAQLAAARRLSTRGALVRNPRTIEALGRVEVLCFDKTGTLTAGRIVLQRVSNGITDQALTSSLDLAMRGVLAASVRASPVAIDNDVLPHATDRAVVDGAASVGVSADERVEGWRPLGELAFESSRGFHAVIGEVADGGIRMSVKGAPEEVISRCTTWRSPNGIVKIDRNVRRRLDAEVERLARRGLRVLGVAERSATSRVEVADERVSHMELQGFLGLADLVRPTASAAIKDLRQAGVSVVMITGDHPSTAKAIAVELNILNGGQVLTGPDLDVMADYELDENLANVSVFARVTPAQKARIVRAYQRIGRVVAMTGDGSNDAPAIRLAHTGIALGANCSPAARAAADLVVVDDRIETIIDAIVEGRAMWSSVRDALAILIGGNIGEVAFTLLATAVSGASPLTARQLLLVNLLTDLLPAMTIALRPPTQRSPEVILHEGPDASLGSALVRQIAVRAMATGGGATGAWMLARATGTRRRAGTVALAALVGTQLGQTIVLGGSSPVVLASAIVSGAVLVVIVQTPGVSQFFGCAPLGPLGWGIVGTTAVAATGASVIMSKRG
jgi:cation-transporting ATPase I